MFNKADLLDEDDMLLFEKIKNIYTKIGYEVYLISAEKTEGISVFKNIIANKMSLLTGHSGVGKSTIINIVLPQQDLYTQEVSDLSLIHI